MLEVRHLTKRYSSIPAVQDVTFNIRPGQILGYLGPNGSGKSTTVKMLVGLVDPSEGEIHFYGEDVLKNRVAFARRFGYVPEEPHLYPHLTGREYLQLVGRLRGIPRALLNSKIDALLTLFGLNDFRHTQMSAYSKGMRQKVSFGVTATQSGTADLRRTIFRSRRYCRSRVSHFASGTGCRRQDGSLQLTRAGSRRADLL